MNIEQIDRHCDEFESLLKRGEALSAEAFLDRQGLPRDEQLLSELADVEQSFQGVGESTRIQADTTNIGRDGDAPAATPRSLVGTVIGGYELLEEIGRGGMGVVYKARQTALNRIVALKMIRSGELASDEDVKRFLVEAEAAASLDHPNIVPIHEIGAHDGQHFFSMGFVAGKSLKERLHEGVLSTREAASLVQTLAEAVHHAHQKGIVHRDLKPGNVLLVESRESRVESQKGASDDRAVIEGQTASGLGPSTLDPRPRITDFGLAKHIEADSAITATGQILGTPSYMPPEQASGRLDDVGPRSDVYSLGAILYSAVTGRPPFQAANVMETLAQVLGEEPAPPRRMNPAVDRDLETICLKCLQKEPSRRYQTAEALAADLSRYLRGEPIAARPVGSLQRTWRWCRRNRLVSSLATTALVLLIAGVVVSASLAAWALNEAKRADDRADDYLAEKREAQNQRTIADNQKQIAIRKAKEADDARRESDNRRKRLELLHYVDTIDRARREWTQYNAAAARTILGLTNPELRGWEYYFLDRLFNRSHLTLRGHAYGFQCVAFSADGKRVVSGGGDKVLRVWDLATKNAVQLRGHTGRVLSAAISPDGKLVASGGDDKTVRVWDAQSGQLFAILTGHTQRVRCVAFSSDGHRIISAGAQLRMWDIEEWEPGQGGSPKLLAVKQLAEGVTGTWFGKDAHRVATFVKGDAVKVWDAKTRKELFELRGHKYGVENVVFSPDDGRILTRDQNRTLRLWDAKTGRRIALAGRSSVIASEAFSADGLLVVAGGVKGFAKTWVAKTGKEHYLWRGHESNVVSVAFSPDGERIVSGGLDNTMRVWNARLAQGSRRLRGHLNPLANAAISRDGKRIVSADTTGTLKVWDAERGKLLMTLSGHTDWAYCVAFSPDGKRIVSGSRDKTVKVWDLAQRKAVLTFTEHEGFVWCAAFSPDGRTIVSGGNDKTLKLWDATTGKVIRSTPAHEGVVRCAAFSPDGRTIVTGSGRFANRSTGVVPGEIKVWDAATGELLHTLDGIEGLVASVSFRADGKRMVSAGFDNTPIVWDAQTWQPLRKLRGHQGFVESAAFNAAGNRIVTASLDKTVKLWEPRSGQELFSLLHSSPVSRIAFSLDGQRIVSSSPPGNSPILWEGPSNRELYTIRDHMNEVSSVAFSPDGERIVSGSIDTTVKVFDASTGLLEHTLSGHKSVVTAVSFSPDGDRIASASRVKNVKGTGPGEIRVWDAQTARSLLAMTGHAGIVTGVAFSPDGERIVSSSADGTLQLWDATTGEKLQTFTGHKGYVSGVDFGSGGNRLVSGGMDGTLKVWNADTGKVVFSVEAHPNTVYCVAFSADGKRVASGGGVVDAACKTYIAGQFKVWDAADGTLLTTGRGHTLPVWSIAFSPDGNRIATGSLDYDLKLWNSHSGDELATLNGHTGWPRSIAFSPDGNRLVSGSGDKTVKIWDVSQ